MSSRLHEPEDELDSETFALIDSNYHGIVLSRVIILEKSLLHKGLEIVHRNISPYTWRDLSLRGTCIDFITVSVPSEYFET